MDSRNALMPIVQIRTKPFQWHDLARSQKLETNSNSVVRIVSDDVLKNTLQRDAPVLRASKNSQSNYGVAANKSSRSRAS